MIQIPSSKLKLFVAVFSVFNLVAGTQLSSPANAEVLFDGAQGTPLGSQGWLYPPPLPLIGNGVVQTPSNGKTNLNTVSQIGDQAGYFSKTPENLFGFLPAHSHPEVPVLDRAQSYTLRWDVQINDEDHSGSTDRAGFSVIVIGEDLKGLEIAFWKDKVWVQNDGNEGPNSQLFTHGEEADFNTMAALTRYDLQILDNGYELSADGMSILSGNLRDYSAYQGTFDFAYTTPSFIFLGDDTTSAGADIDLAFVEVLVPEPSTATVILLALALTTRSRRRTWYS